MQEKRLQKILADIKQVRVAVYGDFCLDAYWMLDPAGSEISVETGQVGRAVAKQNYTLGGAANVVANLAALEPGAIRAIGVTGDDPFGRELRRQLDGLGVDLTHLIVQQETFDTVTFAKPHLDGREQARFDFGFLNRRTQATDHALLKGIEAALQEVDVVIVNQQVPGSIPHDAFIEQANALFARYPNKVVLLDSRHYGQRFKRVVRKINEREAARINGVQLAAEEVPSPTEVQRYAQRLFDQSRQPVFLTRGPRGILALDGECLHDVPGLRLRPQLDPVGAGDTVLSALALCLGAGVSTAETAEFANLAAGVTVQKRYQTGTASPAEILHLARDANYVHQPQLAADSGRAQFLPNTHIERCTSSVPTGQVTHVVFDHDGTISTLRQGWQEIMSPMMIEAILGRPRAGQNDALHDRVARRVEACIDQSTGIQTLLQMEALVDMVREFGFVPADQVLDDVAYKAIYNERICDLVRQRLERLTRGSTDVQTYQIRGAVDFLRALRAHHITLHLASGTDHEDVVNEARALGYADLFNGGIFGAVGDITQYSKKIVMDRIMSKHRLRGPQLAVFGDGPVEIREARRQQALAIGIASDEVRHKGIDSKKRTRLIEAGAQLICPDFSEHEHLLHYLTGH